MTRHEYTRDEIIPVLILKKEGYSNMKISQKTQIPKSTVTALIKNHATDNCAKLKAPNRRGKNKGLTRREKSAIIRNVRTDRQQTLAQLCKYGTGVHPLCKPTVLRVLKEAGFAWRATIGKPFLKPRHLRARLKWAKAHKNWTVEDWAQVIWSDESGRHLGNYSRKDRAWSRADERLDPSVMHGTHAQNRSYVGYWASISMDGTGPIYVLPHKTTMKAALYQDILKDYLLPHYKIGNIFQQDNARYHTTKEVLNFFRDHDVTVMDWPAQSPDLSPIENVWHILNLAIDERMSKIHSYERLEEVVREEWEKIDKKVVINCIGSMPKRCAEVIKAHGGSINY